MEPAHPMRGPKKIPVAMPRLPRLAALAPYIQRIDDARWYSNFGPLCEEFEARLAERFNLAPHGVCTVSNATVGLSLALRAAGEWAARSPETALTWAMTIPDDELRARVVGAIAAAWADRDPAAAARCVLIRLPDGRPQQDAITGIVQRWRQVDSRAALR